MLIWRDTASSCFAEHASGTYTIKRRGAMFLGEFSNALGYRSADSYNSISVAKQYAENHARLWLEAQLAKRYRRIVRYIVWGADEDTGARSVNDIMEIEIGHPKCWTPEECETDIAATFPSLEVEKYTFTVFR